MRARWYDTVQKWNEVRSKSDGVSMLIAINAINI